MAVRKFWGRMLKCARVDTDLVPLKAHMFLYYGSGAGALPYLSVVAKQLGISAAEVGIVNTALLVLSLAVKLLIGPLADKLQRSRILLSVSILIEAVFYIFIVSIEPPRRNDVTTHVNVSLCDPESGTLKICLDLKSKCNVEGYQRCAVICSCDSSSHTFQIELGSRATCEEAQTCYDLSVPSSVPLRKVCLSKGRTCERICPSTMPSESHSRQFWFFAFFRAVSGVAGAVSGALTSSATYCILGEEREKYGYQRLWGTIGWGVVGPVAGYLSDVASEGSSYIDYTPGFCIMGIFTLLDVVVLTFLEVPIMKKSGQILKDVTTVLLKPSSLFFMFAVFNVSCFIGLIWSYSMWYLQDLGASSTLLGLNMAVHCLIGEVPALFFSGWILRKIGYGKTMSLSAACMTVRLAAYCFGKDPWAMLPFEIVYGICQGLFFSVLTYYASLVAPPGTEVTMQGIFAALFGCVGCGFGTFVSGQLFTLVGGRETFFIFFAYSVVFLHFYACTDYYMCRGKSNQATSKTRDSGSHSKKGRNRTRELRMHATGRECAVWDERGMQDPFLAHE